MISTSYAKRSESESFEVGCSLVGLVSRERALDLAANSFFGLPVEDDRSESIHFDAVAIHEVGGQTP